MPGVGWGPQGGQVTGYRGPAARPARGTGQPQTAIEGNRAASVPTILAFTAVYDSSLSRVILNATGLSGTPVTGVVDWSLDQVNWTTVRGGGAVAISSNAFTLPLYDYEFPPDTPFFYRLRTYTAGSVLIQTLTVSITVALQFIWLKFVTAPFLNRRVTLTNWSDIARKSRTGVFQVVSRRAPVIVTDLHSTREVTITLSTANNDESLAVDTALSLGVPMLLHVPDDGTCDLPTMYAAIGDYSYSREATLSHRGKFSIPLTESSAPPPSVFGSPGTWQTVLSTYATWTDVLSNNATWAQVATLIGSSTDIIVGV